MKLTIAAAILMASLFTISAPAEACGYGKADSAKVYGWSGRRAYYRRGRVYGSRAYVADGRGGLIILRYTEGGSSENRKKKSQHLANSQKHACGCL